MLAVFVLKEGDLCGLLLRWWYSYAILLKSHSSNHQSGLLQHEPMSERKNLVGHKFLERSTPTVAACATAVAD